MFVFYYRFIVHFIQLDEMRVSSVKMNDLCISTIDSDLSYVRIESLVSDPGNTI